MSYDSPTKAEDALADLDSKSKTLTHSQMAEEAVRVATQQLMASTEFKKPRLERLSKYWELYDGKVPKKLRQLFNVAIPVFPGMVDTLNAQYDSPVQITFREGDPGDYFKVKKINAAFQMEVMSTAQNSKWDSKFTMLRKHAIINGIAIPKYTATSDPEYKSSLDVVNLKNFHFQPRGGLYIENHLFAGEEEIEYTKSELKAGVANGYYDKKQVETLIQNCSDSVYLPQGRQDMGERLSRFKPLGLTPDSNSYVGQAIYKCAQFILEIDGTRWLLVWHPWSQTWLRFEKYKDISSSELYPWRPFTTHEDDENLLSKSFGDDLYAASDSIVAMFNQELTNREKQNFGARAYDKDMFPDVRKLDDAMHRPDALVPADTKGGSRKISEGVYRFEVGNLNGTVNLIDWITGTLGRNTGATDMAQGSVAEVSKKASVAFAEQKAVSKRIGWGSKPFQTMLADVGKLYVYGLRDHMPSSMAIRLMGENGWDWDTISRLDLSTTKDIDVLISSTAEKAQESELRSTKRETALTAITADPNLAQIVNPKKRVEETLRLGEFDDNEIAEFLDVKTYSDKTSIAKASESIQMILRNKKPDLWHGATSAFMQKIVDYATDKQSTLKEKFDVLIDYAMAHEEIVMRNIERKVAEDMRVASAMQAVQPQADPMATKKIAPTGPSLPPGVSRAMNIATEAQQ